MVGELPKPIDGTVLLCRPKTKGCSNQIRKETKREFIHLERQTIILASKEFNDGSGGCVSFTLCTDCVENSENVVFLFHFSKIIFSCGTYYICWLKDKTDKSFDIQLFVYCVFCLVKTDLLYCAKKS